MKAIDFYSGIGGWSFGYKLAGIDIIKSYEIWTKANITHHANFASENKDVNILNIPLSEIPTDVDLVLGSPPCTQFSYANRGGNGNIQDGLAHIRKFLQIVQHVKPKYWAMENVPRVAKILEEELKTNGSLHEYANLFSHIEVVDASEFGLPQRRKRMIAGNFPFELFSSYKHKTKKTTLGDVIKGINLDQPRDILYGISIQKKDLTDHIAEEELNAEELRMNRDAKICHPVYNKMSFPDKMNDTSRTITATCTRVSRESIVIENPVKAGSYRRLTIRERAMLQGFPITYQFHGNTYAEKAKMAGNAIPPVLTYYLAQSMKHTPPSELPKLAEAYKSIEFSPCKANNSKPEKSGRKYPETRKFKAAIPALRFGSGHRFELVNRFDMSECSWQIDFYYGTSKNIKTLILDEALFEEIMVTYPQTIKHKAMGGVSEIQSLLKDQLPMDIQYAWNHTDTECTSPYLIVDLLNEIVNNLIDDCDDEDRDLISNFTTKKLEEKSKKVSSILFEIGIGLLLGTLFNLHAFDKITIQKQKVS